MRKQNKIICLILTAIMFSSAFISSVFAYTDATKEYDDMIYNDISENDWFYEDVAYLYNAFEANKMMYGDNTFAPNVTFARAMVVSMLHRIEGVPKPQNSKDDAWAKLYENGYFLDACLWAKETGIAKGYGDGEFHPEYGVTREEFATFLLRYAEYKGYDTSARAELGSFSDADSVSNWANEAVSYAVAEKFIRGRTAAELDPQGYTTRAEAAVMLRRFIETYNIFTVN